MVEYPKGLYVTRKKRHAVMQYFTFAIKGGYDIPLQQEQELHIFNLKAPNPGLVPSFNMGGYFLAFSINFWTYWDEKLAKKEAEAMKKKKE